ncbi:MAG: hypothetical protein BGO49_21895 [Planctomycetales bacterium 71-10]|nr:MAG: hypothetical protein BGO49_21895 [Planctomycetales bacterium 71-10]
MDIKMRTIFKAATMAGFLAMASLGGAGRADSIITSQFQGGPGVTITYSTGPTTTATHGGGAGAFTATPTSPSGSAFDAYCVSPEISVGAGLTTLQAQTIYQLNTIGQSFFQYSAFGDVGNRLAYLLGAYGSVNTTNSKAALALAIWDTMDSKFSYTGGSTAVNNLFATYTSFAGYNSAVQYAPLATLYVIDPSTPYQNLIGISSDLNAVPEPASVVSAFVGLGAAGLFAARRARRGA